MPKKSKIHEKKSRNLEKFQKIQAEKQQIQGLYVNSSSAVSEKNEKINALTQKIYELEEKLLFVSQKCQDSFRSKNMSISNLPTSRSTNKSSPKRSKTPGEVLLSNYDSKLIY